MLGDEYCTRADGKQPKTALECLMINYKPQPPDMRFLRFQEILKAHNKTIKGEGEHNGINS